MNIHAPNGVTADIHKNLVQLYKCKCGSSKLRPMAFIIGKNNSAFLYECIECNEHSSFVYTRMPLSTHDVLINIVNTIEDLNRQLEAEASSQSCSKCKSGLIRSVDVTRCRRMALDVVECNSCHFSVPVLSVVRNTLFAYSYDIQLGRKVAKEFPEIALVFCVSALETYFRQLFQYHSDLNEFLVKNRRVNFQSLDETKDILKKEFKINIAKLIEADWVSIPFLVENR